jgi:hypothetical protein
LRPRGDIEEIIVFSINQQQFAHFEAFGFVVLRRLLDDREVSALTGEVTRALGEAFGGIGTDTDPEGTGGIRGDFLPLSLDRTPLSQALIADSSAGRDKRLAWTIEYLPWPGLGDPDRLRAVRDLVVDAVEFDHEGFDKKRWPAWREWAAGARGIASRQVAVERLRLLGVLGAGERR